MSNTAYCYARVSHEYSATSGLSIEAQVKSMAKYVQRQGLTLAQTRFPIDSPHPGVYIDLAQSAYKKKFVNRPAGSMLRQQVQPGDHIVLYSIDRGFRSILDFANTVVDWCNNDIYVHLVSEQFNIYTANGRLMANILAAFAQWKSDILSERIKEALAEKRASLNSKKNLKVKFKPSDELRMYYARQAEQADKTCHRPPGGVAYGYLRASHLDSVDSGLGIDAQHKRVSAYMEWLQEEAGMTPGKIFCDRVVSGYKVPFDKRPEAGRLESHLQEGDHIVVARLDRAWRSSKDMIFCMERWKEKKIVVHFCDLGISSNTTMGNTFLSLMCMVAEWESAFISERTKGALAILKSQGRPISGDAVPIGYKIQYNNKHKQVVMDREVIQQCWFIAHLKDNHKMSFTQISDYLEKIEAQREGREEIPLSGTCKPVSRKKGAKFKRSRVYKPLKVRNWGRSRVVQCYYRWKKELRKVIEDAKKQGLERLNQHGRKDQGTHLQP